MARPNLDFTHRATRGSDVEAWIKRRRDEDPGHGDWWYTLDALLEDYRLLADQGLDFDGHTADLSEGGR